MATIKLFDGDFGSDVMILRCDLSQASSPVEWHSGDEEWQHSQFQCADCRHSEDGLFEIGKQIAAVALEIPTVDCEWEEVDEKHDYIVTCESGIKALVRAEDAASANALWDAEVASGNAEPRIRGMTELADESDVRACVAAGHDYRDGE